MVVRIRGLAYQKGFGCHFHNDNSIGGLRDIPGLVIATPSRGDDALIAHLAERGLRGRVASARSRDSFVPLGPAADLVLLSEEQIVQAARGVLA
jgi:2-oxoisovalerate dehydrogenase E1 component